jgi:hypothetical protein
LKRGKVGATVISVSDFTLAAKRTPGLQAGVFLGVSGHQAWGIRKADKELAKAMNAYIENLRKTSSWSRLIITYFGEQALSVLGPHGINSSLGARFNRRFPFFTARNHGRSPACESRLCADL